MAVTTTNPKFGTGCAPGDSVKRLSFPIDSGAEVPMNFAGDFTIEFWVRFDSIGFYIQNLFDYGNMTQFTGIRMYNNFGQPVLQCGLGPSSTPALPDQWGDITGATNFVINTWFHVAVVRHGNNGNVYIDGVGAVSPPSNWTGNPAVNWGPTANFVSSNFASAFDGLLGAIDEVRISAFARYTADFTPPTDAFATEQCVTPTVVPDVVGETQADATTDIEAALLVVGAVTTEHSDTVPAGIVISQDPVGGTDALAGDPVDLVVSSGPVVCTGIPFEGYIAWPYLDFGILGIDKMMEGFDVVANGTFRVSFGYSQRDFSLATPDYALDGDTLIGGMTPMPLTAPSFQMRLTFDGEQAWEWFASNLYINNEGPG